MHAFINVPLGSCYYPAYRRRQVAAALRAAAHHLPNDRRVLAAIAAKLEGDV
jgi:hypothetical protein